MSFFPPTPPYLPLLPLVSFLFLLTILIVYSLIRRRCSLPENEKRRLPPGSMGWPYIGETINLYTQNPNTFFSERQNRHGKMFKSHILGCPCVMISSPEVAKIILVTKSDLFKPTYPTSKEMMIGPEALFFHQGQYHSHLKKLIQSSFLPSAIKPLISNIEAIVGEVEGLKELYGCIEKGYNSMPLNVVGTPFNKAMKARKLLNERLRKMIQKRRENGDHGGGLLGVLLGLKGNEQLNDSQIADNIIGVIFAAHDTTASVLTWLLKYLHDHPHLLDAVKIYVDEDEFNYSIYMEQEDIKCRRLETNRGITWDDTRHMPLSHRVLQETLRAASILSFTFREAVEDVEIEGYLIPRGWKVLPLFRTIHYCSDFFPDPDKFDPSRFELELIHFLKLFGSIDVDMSGDDAGRTSCKHVHAIRERSSLVPGQRACEGGDAHPPPPPHHLLQASLLEPSSWWDVVGEDDGIQYGPFPVPKQGLPIKLHRIDET
ncbi:cytochrome P450 [Cynara cardunculus var. scolymus]|uniref:Cytochrome P450 n=1 Tax=Cynara cardunculus var. scolymus TaxID=59895 RepID=A0A103XPW3_CYNCS|nr:cytochrome P450 [Cynara cardunculus var. scolymus]